MSPPRIPALVLAVAVIAIGVAWAAFVFFFADANSNRGLHLLVALDAAEVRASGLEALASRAPGQLREARIAFDGVKIADGAVEVRIAKPEQLDDALKALRAMGSDIDVTGGAGGKVTLTHPPATQAQRLASAVGLTIDILQRRCDAARITVRRIERDTEERIHIHAANPADAPKLKDLIVKGGRLTLHEVHPTLTGREAQGGTVPAGYRVYPSPDMPAEPFVLRVAPIVRGEELADAQAGLDPMIKQPVITFRFTNEGARKFGRFTQENVGKPLAIVIDDAVVSAPIIREPILGGTGQISGNFTVASAEQLAIALRSGVLPARLTIVKEWVVTREQ